MQSCYLHQTVQEIRNTPGQGHFESIVEEVRTAVKVTVRRDGGHLEMWV